MDKYRIGEFATITGLKIETVRYYETHGILNKSKRDSNGYRYFTVADVKRIGFVKKCKEFGFTLVEIKWMVKLKIDEMVVENHIHDKKFNAEQLAHLYDIVSKKVGDVDDKIEAILKKKNDMLTYFDNIRKECSQGDNFCPIKR